MAAVPGNPIDPKMLGILAANNAAGGAPYTPVGPTGSPFIEGGGTPYTPNTRGIGGGMSIGSYGQWALPRPAGVSLGYVPTEQTIGSAANDIAPRTLESYLPPPPPPAPVAKKTTAQNFLDLMKRWNQGATFGRGGSSPNYGGSGGSGTTSGSSFGGGAARGGGVGGFGGKSGYK